MPVACAVAGMSTGGVKTLSITWMIPLDARTSAVVTWAAPTETAPLLTVNLTLSPFTVVAIIPSLTSADGTEPETT